MNKPLIAAGALCLGLLGVPAVAVAAPMEQPPNMNCTLLVPADPLTAGGLATPYQLRATDPNAGPCNEANGAQAAFVEAAILDPASHHISIYHPVVVDAGTSPAVPPVPVTLPADATVGIWFGFNGDTLRFRGPGSGDVVGGLRRSPFGQFGYLNARAFFRAARGVNVPPLGTAKDGLPCPTSRDFMVVDQDQSDNLATQYRIVNGKIAQDTAATRAGTLLPNGSDENLLARFIDPALGCTPFLLPSLDDPGAMVPSLAANELSADALQPPPEALVPLNDPMVKVGDNFSRTKLSLYRVGVDQPRNPNVGQSPRRYCRLMRTVGLPRLQANTANGNFAVPGPGGVPLSMFLADRFTASLQELNCPNRPAGNFRNDNRHDGARRR